MYCVLYFQRMNIGITLYTRAHLGIGKILYINESRANIIRRDVWNVDYVGE